jgi:hypothetical protein
MKATHLLAAAAFGAMLLAGCQPAPTEAPPAAEPAAEAETAATEAAPVALPCGVLAQRNWDAELGAGSSPTLTVSGEIDLGTPGFGVSLTRDTSEASGATTALLTLALRAPTGIQPQVVTAHPVRYFGPAAGLYTSVRISCDGAELTTIDVGE